MVGGSDCQLFVVHVTSPNISVFCPTMSIVDFAPAFAKLNLPSVEDYQKRKVALISGMCPIRSSARFTNHQVQASPDRMVHICIFIFYRSFDPSNRVNNSTELLLSKGYQVHGIIRRSSSFNTGRLHHLYEDQHERESLINPLYPPPSKLLQTPENSSCTMVI